MMSRYLSGKRLDDKFREFSLGGGFFCRGQLTAQMCCLHDVVVGTFVQFSGHLASAAYKARIISLVTQKHLSSGSITVLQCTHRRRSRVRRRHR